MAYFVAAVVYFGIALTFGYPIAMAWAVGFICASVMAAWEVGKAKLETVDER